MRAIENILTVGGGMIVLLVAFTIGRSIWHFIVGQFARRRAFPAHDLIGNPAAVITLIHGTFARGAHWTQPGSALSRAVCDHFDGRVQLRRFDWSGRNSFRARARAAEELAADAREVANRYIGVPHYCIAHSHGGNVAIEAAIECRNKEIDGLVCLATPVLTTARRNFTPLVRIAVGFGFWVLMMLLFLDLESAETSDTEAIGIGLTGLLAAGWYWWAQKVSERVCATRPHNLLDPRRIAFIRSPFDEASGIIGLANIVSWLIGRLTDGPFAMFDYLDRIPTVRSRVMLALKLSGVALGGLVVGLVGVEVKPLAAFLEGNEAANFGYFGLVFLAMAVGIVGLFGTLMIPLLRRARESWWYMLFLSGPFLVTMLLAGMMFIPAIVLVSVVHALTVGVELFLCSVFVEVAAEPCPPGNWTIYQVTPPGQRESRHSSVYESHNGLAALRTALAGLMDADSVTLMADEPAAMPSPPLANAAGPVSGAPGAARPQRQG